MIASEQGVPGSGQVTAVSFLIVVIYPVKCVTFKHHFDQNTFLKRDDGRHVPGKANAANGERGTQKRSQRSQQVSYARKQLVKLQKKRSFHREMTSRE